MNSIYIQFFILILLVLLSGFFSSAETSMTAVNKLRINSFIEEGNPKAIVLGKILADSNKMLSTILIGNNIVNMAASSLMTTLTIQLFGNVYVGLATGILTLLILLFGEITPKTLATLYAEKIALSYARVIYALMIILTPVIYVVGKLSGWIMKVFHIDPNAGEHAFTEREIRTIVNDSQQSGVIENEEKEMIYNVFDFGDSTAREVMIPRIDMTFVNVNATYEELMEIFREDRHTRFPVFDDTTDNVIGIINVKDLILLETKEGFSVRKILRPAYFTYEYKKTADLLLEMRKSSFSLAIVLDEYGSTAGLVTLEDLLEEIVGDIRDEYDTDEKDSLIEIQPGREYVADGSAKLDEINETLGIHLESEEYDSLGGFIIEQLDSLPVDGESLTLENGVRLVVDVLNRNRIEQVHIWLTKKNTTEDSSAHNAEKSSDSPQP